MLIQAVRLIETISMKVSFNGTATSHKEVSDVEEEI
jgi:hypothetical protein